MGAIITDIDNELAWSDLSLVVWGGLRLGGVVTVHLPLDPVNYAETWGAKMLCMPGAGVGITWSWEFGYAGWAGAILCRRCFDHKQQCPKPKHRPKEGWYTYRRRPVEERIYKGSFPDESLRRESVVRRILAVSFRDFNGEDLDGDVPSRIIEV